MKFLGFSALAAVILAMLAVLTPVGNQLLGWREWHWRQTLAVTVTTPSGPVTGSATSTVTFGISPEWFADWTSDGGYARLRGEAVALEIRPGEYLFVLLDTYGAATATRTFTTILPTREDIIERFDTLVSLRETRALPRDLYPSFVTFSDISDPTTIQPVDPDALAATFGPGVSLATLTLSITDAPQSTTGLATLLAWLGPDPHAKLGPATDGPTKIPFHRTISHGDFIRR